MRGRPHAMDVPYSGFHLFPHPVPYALSLHRKIIPAKLPWFKVSRKFDKVPCAWEFHSLRLGPAWVKPSEIHNFVWIGHTTGGAKSYGVWPPSSK